MRILHTSDWHLLKPIGRRDRTDEYEAVLDQVVAVADSEEIDLVVHSGDLFDRAIPSPEAIHLALDTLVRLADGGRRPVVVVAGNHDSPRLFEALAGVLRPLGVHLVGELRPPAEGGALVLDTAGGKAVVSAVPYVTQGRVVDFMDEPGRAYGTYADRMQAIIRPHHQFAERHRTDAVTILAAHFMVGGVSVRGGHGPTGMKELSIGEAFAVTEAAVNHDFSYVALGHIHLPQSIPGPVTGEYAGSLLQLDFGEAGEVKRVVIVDAAPGRAATLRSIPLTAGRELQQLVGTWDEMSARTDLDESWLDLTVQTEAAPHPDTIDEWRTRFPRVVRLKVEHPTEEGEGHTEIAGRPIDDLYAEYHGTVHGAPEDGLMELVRDVLGAAEA